MNSSGVDTHNLAAAAHDQAIATERLKGAGEAQAAALDKLRHAGEVQAAAANRLRQAGEAQARAMDGLRGAGEAQARSTADLAVNSGKQIAALSAEAKAGEIQADAARRQATAIAKSADATIAQSKATDRLAEAGARQADFASQALLIADRPWLGLGVIASAAPDVGHDLEITIPINNVGRGPALNTRAYIQVNLYDVTTNIVALPLCDINKCAASTVFPGAGLTFTYTIPANKLDVVEVSKLKNLKSALVVQSRVDYADPHGVVHHSVSCSFLRIASPVGYTSCPFGNAAD